MLIDIFCRVVDNFGDAAVAWRLAKGLSILAQDVEVRLFIDGIGVFRDLVPGSRPRIEVFDALDDFDSSPADVLIEAFGERCPILREESFKNAAPGKLRCRLLIHLEYLTAEPWAQSYHLLPSPTGVPGVEKYFFVPGFRSGTGGLFLDREFLAVKARPAEGLRRAARDRWAPESPPEAFWVLLFSYEHDFSHFWEDLSAWSSSEGRPVVVFVAAGRAVEGAISSWNRIRRKATANRIQVVELGFMPQGAFDELLLTMDFSVVRGEDSWLRAVLSGKPFLWHAYLQPEGHQKIKVEAYLDVMKPFFESASLYEEWAETFRLFNDRETDDVAILPREHYGVFWKRENELRRVLEDFVAYAKKHLDLEASLLEFFRSFQL